MRLERVWCVVEMANCGLKDSAEHAWSEKGFKRMRVYLCSKNKSDISINNEKTPEINSSKEINR